MPRSLGQEIYLSHLRIMREVEKINRVPMSQEGLNILIDLETDIATALWKIQKERSRIDA